MKKIGIILIAFAMIIGLFSTVPVVVKAEHTHIPATDVWYQDDYGHWNPCYGVGNCEDKLNYTAHQTGEYSKMCSVCGRIPHKCSSVNADCTYGSTCDYCPYSAPLNPENYRGRYAVSIDDNNHKIVCYCGHVYVESEPHQFNNWSSVEGKPDIEESWCEVAGCMHVATRNKEHSHSYSKATCISPAKCSCGATTGTEDASNHIGGTEIKGAVAATEDKDGYTGDTYCKGCGAKIKNGEAITENTSTTTTQVPTTSGSDITTSDSDNEQNVAVSSDKDSDEDTSKGDKNNLLWLWIALIVIAVGGGVAAIVIVKKKQGTN